MAQSIEELYRFGLKFFVEPDCTLNSSDCIPIFHRWIQTQALEWQFHANDRLLAPPGTESVSTLTPALQEFMSIGYPGEPHHIEIDAHSKNRLKIQLTTSQPISLDSLFERLNKSIGES